MTLEGHRHVGESGVDGEFDVVVVGAGLAGLYATHRLTRHGFSVAGIEAAEGVGGTWWWNRYPGARCDIESLDYSYSFDAELEQEWRWIERYATQPEILAYLDHVADRFDLRRWYRFGTRVNALQWMANGNRWLVSTDVAGEFQARFVVLAVGCLSAAKDPEIPGVDRFCGPIHHTGRWPHGGVDVAGRRVGVIGTGSSGIQSIPILADEVGETGSLTVFQRTAGFTVPAHNRPLSPEELAGAKDSYRERRKANRMYHGGVVVDPPVQSALAVSDEERQAAFDRAWERGTLFGILATFNDLFLDEAANDTAAEYLRGRIREIVTDPDVAEALSPRSYPVGAKRLCLDTGYYATFNRPNVHLVDLRATPITTITESGIETSDGHHDLDVIVFATGFDAMTGAILALDIHGRDGHVLREDWAAGPRTYLGLAVHGFPNLFVVTGPGSPSVLTNMAMSIEQHVEWITDCLEHVRTGGFHVVEAERAFQDDWTDHVTELAGHTLLPRAASWYLGANVPGKPRVFMPYVGGLPVYRQVCDGVAADGYRGFRLTKAP